MTGLLIFAALAVFAMAGLWWLGRVRGNEAMLTLAALFVAAAGYTWQGSPGLAGAPAQADKHAVLRPDSLYMIERQSLLNVYGEAGQYLTFADGLNRAGEDQAAVSALGGAIARHPKDVALRVAYAHALFVLADNNVSPAVTLAFDRAAALDPADPAPRYFEGLAHLEQGDAMTAERLWRDLLARLPETSPWHDVLAKRLAFIDMLRHQQR